MPLWLLDFKENAVRMIQYKGHTLEYKTFFCNKNKNPSGLIQGFYCIHRITFGPTLSKIFLYCTFQFSTTLFREKGN